jgi:hypothetical protein
VNSWKSVIRVSTRLGSLFGEEHGRLFERAVSLRSGHRLVPQALGVVEVDPLCLSALEAQVGVDLLEQRPRGVLKLGGQRDYGVRSADQEALDAGRPFVARCHRVRGAGTAEQDDREKARRPDPAHGPGFEHSTGGTVKRDAQ